MSDNSNPPPGQPFPDCGNVAFATAFGLHAIDHFRRGMTASPPSVMVGGTIQGVFVLIALVLVLRRNRWAARATYLVGFGSAALFT